MLPILLEKQEAINRFKLNSGKFDVLPHLGYETVQVLEGETIIHSDLTSETLTELVFDNNRTTKQDLIIVNGDLTVKGVLNLRSHAHKTYLVVLGNLYCDTLISSNTILHVTGDAHIKHVFNAEGSSGITSIEGTVYVPYFLHSNHCAKVNLDANTKLINYYGDDDGGWKFEFDYFENDLPNVLIENVCPEKELNVDLFIKCVKSGNSPFKDNMNA